MGAHNAATREYARRRVQWLADRLDRGEAAREWQTRLKLALSDKSENGTLKGWMTRNDTCAVETLQVTLQLSGADAVGLRNAWAPGTRQIDATHSTYVNLGVSRRDYAGMVTFYYSPTLWVGFDKGPDDHSITLIAYHRVS